MKIKKTKTNYNGVVSGEYEAIFEVNVEELNEIKKALDIVAKYKNLGMEALNLSEKYADITKYDFLYNNKNKTVSLIVKQAAIG